MEIKHTFDNGDQVEIRWTNINPDSLGGQHTNGPPPAWFRLTPDGKWLRGQTDNGSTISVRKVLSTLTSNEDVIKFFLLDTEAGK